MGEKYSLRVVAWTLLLGPFAVWPFAWRKLLLAGGAMRGRATASVLILTILGTASYAFLWLCILFRPLLGGDYSARRTNTVIVNGIIVIVIGIFSTFQKHPARPYLVIASVLTVLSWFYVLAIGAAV